MKQILPSKSKYNKEDIINQLIKSRIEQCASTRTLINFLTVDLGFGTTMAYEYMKWMRERIAECYNENPIVKEETILQYEEVIEKMRRDKNWKMWSELNRELNKIKQIAIEKHEVSGKIEHQFTGLDININYTQVNMLPQTQSIQIENTNEDETKD